MGSSIQFVFSNPVCAANDTTSQGCIPPSAPDTPANLAVSFVTHDSVVLRWDGVTGVLVNYRVTHEAGTETLVVNRFTGTSRKVTGLVAGTSYTFDVYGRDYDSENTTPATVSATTRSEAASLKLYRITSGECDDATVAGSEIDADALLRVGEVLCGEALNVPYGSDADVVYFSISDSDEQDAADGIFTSTLDPRDYPATSGSTLSSTDRVKYVIGTTHTSGEGRYLQLRTSVPGVQAFTFNRLILGSSVPAPTDVTVTSAAGADKVGVRNTLQMMAVVAPAGTNQRVAWSVDETGGGRASISATGLLTGVVAGQVTVKASSRADSSKVGELGIEVVASHPFAQVDGTDGTSEHPYQIDTIKQLNAIRDTRGNSPPGPNYLNSHFLLTADLDFNDYVYEDPTKGWLPIAHGIRSVTKDPHFTGSFDGDGHVIKNLEINRPDLIIVGLFGRVKGRIDSLGLEGVRIVGNSGIGGLSGHLSGGSALVSDSYTTGQVNGGGTLVGGIVGGTAGNSKLERSYSSAQVTGTQQVGGLVGQFNQASIKNCYATGAVTGEKEVGGLAGWSPGAKFTTSYATGRIAGDTSTGGMVGNHRSTSQTNCYWNSDDDFSGQAMSTLGTPLTTDEMYVEANFTGWDFDDEDDNDEDTDIWTPPSAGDERFPHLKGIKNGQVLVFAPFGDPVRTGASFDLEPTFLPATLGSGPVYVSSDEAIATVDAAGRVTPAGPGTTVITIRRPGDLVYSSVVSSQKLEVRHPIVLSYGSILSIPAGVGDEVGTLSVTPKGGDTDYTYTFGFAANGDGGGKFEIVTSSDVATLKVNEAIDTAQDVDIMVTATSMPTGDDLSQTITVRVVDATVAPDAPLNLVGASLAGTTAVRLTWDPPAANDGADVTGYQIRVNAGSRWTVLVSDTGNTATTYSHGGFTPGSTLTFQVRGLTRDMTQGAYSPTAEVVIWTPSPPGRPTNLILTPTAGETTMVLNWVAPGDTGGSDVTGYRIEGSEDGLSWAVVVEDTMNTLTEFSQSDLTYLGTVHYRVSAINVEGPGSPSTVRMAVVGEEILVSLPGAPRDLTATTSSTNTRVVLRWVIPQDTGGAPIAGYRIQVSRDLTDWMDVVSDTMSQDTMHSHETGLRSGDMVHYQVFAVNSRGEEGPGSDVVSGTVGAGIPGVPTDLEVTSTVGTQVLVLSWMAPTDPGSSAIVGYRIERSADGSTGWSRVVEDTGNTDMTYTHTGLTDGERVYYRVIAINGEWPGNPSNVVFGTVGLGVPGAPTGLMVTSQTGSLTLVLSWVAPQETGGSEITGYKIERSPNGMTGWTRVVEDTDNTDMTYTHMGLSGGDTIHYRVFAINIAGVGDASNVAFGTVAQGVPDAPTDLMVTSQTGSLTLVLSWVAPQETGGSGITGYKIERSGDGMTGWTPVVEDTDNTDMTYTHMSLSGGDTIHYRVFAINITGVGDASNVAFGTVGQEVPGVPTGLMVTSETGSLMLVLSWRGPTDTGSSAITGYKIERSADGMTGWMPVVEDTDNTDMTYTHMGLSGGDTIHYRVFAINITGVGGASNVAFGTVGQGIPGVPTGLMVTSETGSLTLVLSWRGPTDAGSSAITGYKIERSGDGMTGWTPVAADTGNTDITYTHMGLSGGDTIHYRVFAINIEGVGDASNVAFGTVGQGVPGVPTGLMVTSETGSLTLVLSWVAPQETGGSAITGYKIERSGDGMTGWTPVVADTGNTDITYTHMGLSGGDTIHYRVFAVNITGVGDASNVASGTVGGPSPMLTVPGVPGDLSATPSSTAGTIELRWVAPQETGGSAITGYKIESSADGQAPWAEVEADTGDTTTYTHSGLTEGETIHYRVSAINSVGTGMPSNVTMATVGGGGPFSSHPLYLPTIKVYPNPAQDVVYLDLEQGRDYKVVLLSLAGQVVAGASYGGGGSFRLALTDISGGVYLLKVEDSEGGVRSFRIVL